MPPRVHLLGLTGAAMILSIMVAQPVLPLYLQDRGLPPVEVGLIVGLLSFALILTELGAMAVSRRVGRRRTMILGSLGGAAAQAWFTFAATRPEWYLSRLLFGAFRGMLWPVLFAEVSDAAPEGRHGRAFSLFWLYFGIGLLAGPLIGGWLGDARGLRASLFLSAALALGPVGFAAAFSAQRDAPIPLLAAFGRLLRQREVVAVWGLNAIGTTVFGLYLTFLPLYAASRSLTAAQIGLIFTVGSAAFTAAQLPAGRLLERIAPAALLIPAFLVRGLATAAVPFVGTFAGLAGLNGAASIIGAVIPPVLSSRLAGVARGHAVVVMGGFNAAADVGFFLGPAIGGIAASYGLAWPFLLALPLAAAGVILNRVAFASSGPSGPLPPDSAQRLAGIAGSGAEG
ncbi:MAG: MFS transporter [Armatimonadetes bacterium]|nr:MFS transporter [Armatimonadota bacterium]